MKKEYVKINGKTQSRPATVIIDWNQTLVNEAWKGPFTWTEGAVKALRSLLSQGYEVKVHTCSLYTKSWEGDGEIDQAERRKQYDMIRNLLDESGLREIEVITDISKIPAVAYVDDKAVRYKGNWRKVLREIGV